MVNRHLDFAEIQHVPAVTVDASGTTSYKGAGFAASVITQVSVELVWGYVPDPDYDEPDTNAPPQAHTMTRSVQRSIGPTTA